MPRRIKVERHRPEEPDEFLSGSRRTYLWISERRRPLMYAILALVVAIGAGRGVVAYKERAQLKAQDLFYQAFKAHMAAPRSGQSQDAILEGYNKVLRRYPRTAVAPLAKLQVANVLYWQGRYAEAAARFSDVLRAFPPDHPLRGLVLLNLAYCYYATGRLPEAIATAHRIVDDPTSSVRDYAAFAIARWERERGEQTRAQEALEFIRENFPDSPFLNYLRDGEIPEEG